MPGNIKRETKYFSVSLTEDKINKRDFARSVSANIIRHHPKTYSRKIKYGTKGSPSKFVLSICITCYHQYPGILRIKSTHKTVHDI